MPTLVWPADCLVVEAVDGKVLRSEPLVALRDVGKGGFWRRLIDTIRLWFA